MSAKEPEQKKKAMGHGLATGISWGFLRQARYVGGAADTKESQEAAEHPPAQISVPRWHSEMGKQIRLLRAAEIRIC